MAGTPQRSPLADDLEHCECSVHNSHQSELIRAIQEVGGKECFATDLSEVCPDIHCRWRGDCLSLSMI